jgi:microcystin-dependent protein
MATPFISEIKIVSFAFAPRGWALCNGQTMAIQQNAALFSLIGTYYGGNGTTTFQLPNLQARMPIHMGSSFTLGQVGGEQAHTLTVNEVPPHTHQAMATTAAPSAPSPTNNLWCQNSVNTYNPTANSTMAGGAISLAGGSQPHDNMSPYLVLNFIIALTGIFPSRN